MEKIPGNERSPEEDKARVAFLGTHLALQYVDRAARTASPITRDVIENIHRRCMNGLLPENVVGQYRTCNVGIGGASITPPGWRRVALLMGEFLEEINKKIALCGEGANFLPKTVETIAFTHYAFVRIHPFEDGNGRTVRLLCDLLAKKFGLRPIIIWPSENQTYLQVLEAVNRSGNLAHLELFLIDCFLKRYQGERDSGEEILEHLEALRKEKIRIIERQAEQSSLKEISPFLAKI